MKLISHLKVLSTQLTVRALIIITVVLTQCDDYCASLWLNVSKRSEWNEYIFVLCMDVLCFNWKWMYTTRAAHTSITIIYAMENWQKFCFTDDSFIYVIQSNRIELKWTESISAFVLFVCLFVFISFLFSDLCGWRRFQEFNTFVTAVIHMEHCLSMCAQL